jgi:predicted KAP-like P-loop ATPase
MTGNLAVPNGTEEVASAVGPQLNLSADRPISGKAEDRLGRGPFASRLATAIASWKGHESLVIGLYGSWGSGKSSVKNLVLEVLFKQGATSPEILEFNPWQWRGHDEVSAAFFREVLRKLGRGSNTGDAKKLAKVLRRYAKFLGLGGVLFDGARTALGSVLGIVGLLALGLPPMLTSEAAATFGQTVGVATLAIGALLIWGERVVDRIAQWLEAKSETGSQSLEEQKRAAADELRKFRKLLLIVIDDVDRLSPKEIRAVFQLIKANADFPNFVYLVLFQRDKVEQALGKEDDGSRYLEKIVQVGFDLPLARQEDIDRILFEGLDLLLGKDAENLDQRYWGTVYYGSLRQYFRNLRDVNRFLGVFGFHLGLLRSENILEVNPVDLIALETLSLFEPSLYRDLPKQKALLTGRATPNGKERAEVKEQYRAILNAAPEERRQGLRELLRELFPSMGDAFGGMQHGSDFYETWSRELRVCSPEVFDRYFEYSLSPSDVSQAEINRLLARSSNGRALTEDLKRLAADGRLLTALERLVAKVEVIDPNNIADVLIALFNIGDDLPERALGFFSMPPEWAAMRLVTKLLLREGDVEKREKLLERAIREADALSLAVIPVAWDSDPERRKKNPEDVLIREESLPKLQALCLERIRNTAAEGKLHGQRDLAHLLYRWREWGGSDEVKDWVRKRVSNQPGAISFLRAFLHSGTSQGAGDRVSTVHWFIRLKETEDFADSEQIEKSLAEVSLVALPERDRLAVEEFRRAIARKRAGKVETDWGWERD